jgi:hypothetical protein
LIVSQGKREFFSKLLLRDVLLEILLEDALQRLICSIHNRGGRCQPDASGDDRGVTCGAAILRDSWLSDSIFAGMTTATPKVIAVMATAATPQAMRQTDVS